MPKDWKLCIKVKVLTTALQRHNGLPRKSSINSVLDASGRVSMQPWKGPAPSMFARWIRHIFRQLVGPCCLAQPYDADEWSSWMQRKVGELIRRERLSRPATSARNAVFSILP